MKQVFQAEDGGVFATAIECITHESKLKVQREDRLTKYRNGYSYRNSKYSDNEYGTWQVYGEDPNCDFGGSHHQPYLGTYQGKFIDVARKAVELVGFWQWGAGGEIRKIEVNKV